MTRSNSLVWEILCCFFPLTHTPLLMLLLIYFLEMNLDFFTSIFPLPLLRFRILIPLTIRLSLPHVHLHTEEEKKAEHLK